MASGPEEYPGDPRSLEPSQQGPVVRRDDGATVQGQTEDRIVRGAAGLDDAERIGKATGRATLPIADREDVELLEDRARHGEVRVSEESSDFSFEVESELKREKDCVRVEEDQSGQRNRTSMLTYMALEVRIALMDLNTV